MFFKSCLLTRYFFSYDFRLGYSEIIKNLVECYGLIFIDQSVKKGQTTRKMHGRSQDFPKGRSQCVTPGYSPHRHVENTLIRNKLHQIELSNQGFWSQSIENSSICAFLPP